MTLRPKCSSRALQFQSHPHSQPRSASRPVPSSIMPSFHRLLLTLSLLSLWFSLSSFAPICASGELPATLSKIQLSVYYESLCPYGAYAFVSHIAKLFENGIINIVDLKLVPFGNAKIYENNTVECQHGADECMLNIVQACAIHIWRPQQSVYFSFIACIEEKYLDYKRTEWRECFDKLSLDPEPIDECYDSGAGLELLRINEGKTNALQPPKTYLPWIIVNGESLNKDFENLERIICNAYRGRDLPFPCLALLKTVPEKLALH